MCILMRGRILVLRCALPRLIQAARSLFVANVAFANSVQYHTFRVRLIFLISFFFCYSCESSVHTCIPDNSDHIPAKLRFALTHQTWLPTTAQHKLVFSSQP